MPALFVNEGVQEVVNGLLISGFPAVNMTLRLFTDTNPVLDTDQFSGTSHTECTLSGYASVDYIFTNWLIVVASSVATCTYPTIEFDFDPYIGGVTIYGMMVTLDFAGGTFIWFEQLLDTPFAVPSLGGILKIDTTFSYGQCA